MSDRDERPLSWSEGEEMRIANDDKSPLIELLTCIKCSVPMKIANDAQDRDVVEYRCDQCGGIELVRLFRRSRDAPK